LYNLPILIISNTVIIVGGIGVGGYILNEGKTVIDYYLQTLG
jgi:hypothetical protein